MMTTFESLVSEAQAAAFAGWDFSWLNGRWIEGAIPWDYRERVRVHFADVRSLLDLGTGGGEMLASMAPLPADTWATENYPPNGPIARARLEPLGVRVMTDVPDNALPFADSSFDLVIDRHESYDPLEVFRIVKPGGRFITQQVGGRDCRELNELLQDEVSFEFADWGPDMAASGLETAGFQLLDQREAWVETWVSDIGAVVYYLRQIPWQIERFTVEGYRARLLALHQQMLREGGLTLHSHRFYIEALKAG